MSIIRKLAAVALSLTTAFCALPALSAPVQAATLPPLIHIDTPAPNAAVSQSGSSVPITISGWAVSAAKITSVTATFDGHAAAGAALNLSRPDVAKKYPAYPYAKTSGFKANMLVVPSIAEGFHTVTVTAKTADGKTFSATVRVQYFDYGEPVFSNSYFAGSNMPCDIRMESGLTYYKITHAEITKTEKGKASISWDDYFIHVKCNTYGTIIDVKITTVCVPTGKVVYCYTNIALD